MLFTTFSKSWTLETAPVDEKEPKKSFHFRGEVINGGFGLLLDGSEESAERATRMLNWDVSNGVARRYYYLLSFLGCKLLISHSRSWSGNENARKTIYRAMAADGRLRVTMPHPVPDIAILDKALEKATN